MTRTGIISLIVLVIIVAAGVWYWAVYPSGGYTAEMNTASSTDEMASTTGGTTGGSPASGTATTYGQLVAQGGNYTCSLYTLQGSNQVRGTLYGSGGKTRADLVSSVNGTDVTMHVIHENGYTYTWIDGQSTGTKVAASTGPSATQPTGGVIGVADNAQVSSNCTPWVPTAAQFTLPTAIKFVAQ